MPDNIPFESSPSATIPSGHGGSEKGVVREGILDAVKIGSGETYIGAFGVMLGGTPLQIGALATLPPLLGSISQSIGVRLVEHAPSRRNILVWLMRLQGILWLPIALIPFVFGAGWTAVAALITIFSLYHMTVGIMAPVWNSLIGDVIPAETRGAFFGTRNRFIAIATFSTLAVAGEVIHQCTEHNATVYGFLIVFICAGISRILAARAFGAVEDPSLHTPKESKFTFWQFIRRVRHSNFVRFVLFVSCMNFSVAVAGPYFAMYMLKDLNFTYIEYTIVVASAVVAQFVVMKAWGTISDQYGNRKILTVCGRLAALNPLFWLVSTDLWWIVITQLYSGFCWAGFNLAAANFVFDAVTPAKRARCIAYQAIINGVLVSLGSFLGGLLVTRYGAFLPTHLGIWASPSPFLALFLLSAVLRLVVVGALMPTFREVRPVQHIRSRELLIRVSSIRPLSGATFSVLSLRRTRRKRP